MSVGELKFLCYDGVVPYSDGALEKVDHWSLVIRLSGPDPTYELALALHAERGKSCCYVGSFIPSSLFTPHPRFQFLDPGNLM